MAVHGSNTFEWEPCVKVILVNGETIHQPALRVRQKDVLISILGVNLGVWTEWEWVDDTPVYRREDGILCDYLGNPI